MHSVRRFSLMLLIATSLSLGQGGCLDGGGGSSGSSSISIPASATVLPTQFVPQSTQVWCWAAVTTEVLNYFGFAGDQCQIVSLTLSGYTNNSFCCPFVIGGPCFRTGQLFEIQQALSLIGGIASSVTGPLTFQQIRSEINAGDPIIAAYLGSFSGHVVVIFGYDDTSGEIYIHDPFYGQFVVPYASTFTYNGSLIWSQSIVTDR